MQEKEKYSAAFIPPKTVNDIREKIAETGITVRGYDVKIEEPHTTLEYRDAESLREYFGERAEIKVIGYATGTPTDTRCSGAIEAVSVEIRFPNNLDLQNRFENMESHKNDTCGREGGFQLHITMSFTGDNGEPNPMRAVEAGFLEFIELPEDKQFVIKGAVFGGCMEDDSVDIGPDIAYADLEVEIIDAVDVPLEDASPDSEMPEATETPTDDEPLTESDKETPEPEDDSLDDDWDDDSVPDY